VQVTRGGVELNGEALTAGDGGERRSLAHDRRERAGGSPALRPGLMRRAGASPPAAGRPRFT
jgi:hypothetical protein